MPRSRLFRFVLAVLLFGLEAARLAGATLIPAGSVWRYLAVTNASPPAAWRGTNFSDLSWPLGPAPFAYGEPAFAGTGTDLTGMQNAYTVIHLRRAFAVPNPSMVAALTLRAVFDDGFIVWINGRRVATVNAPAMDAAATNGALALGTVEYGPPADYDLGDPAAVLVPGVNQIAILVLNATPGSSDLVFDAELFSTERPTLPPSIIAVSPAAGVVNALTAVSVFFSRAVTGVTANQFLLGGVPADAVTGAGATYTFTFRQPPWGPVPVSWGPLHAITDLGQTPIRFDAAAPGSTWNYELIDPLGPAVVSRLPAPGLELRSLAQVEVVFNRPMTGVDASDLRLNGVPATDLVGIGAGPYRFTFPPARAGTATLSWSPGHGIVSADASPQTFNGAPWTYTVSPSLPAPDVVINEIMAENFSAPRDEDLDPEDWIELHNRGAAPVNMGGWSLSVDRDEAGQWVFPPFVLPAGGHAYLWASGKDRTNTAGGRRLHTNFKLNAHGDTLRLYGPELPRLLVDEMRFPEQAPDFSYGRLPGTGTNLVYRFFVVATPGARNGDSAVTNKAEEVYFSVERGFYSSPFNLSLVSRTPGANIRFTLDGSPPTPANGFDYTNPIPVNVTRVLRAAAFLTNHIPSRVRTHTYLYNVPAARRLLPVVSLVTATNNLYGRTGIMEYNPRNTQNHGVAWERPVSMEWIEPADNDGFHVDAGLRVAGGDYIRGLYNYRATTLPESKYSFRVYFRGEYGQGRLRERVLPGTTLDSFNTLQLRAGMNDPVNPFLKDEFVRALCDQMGLVACHGTFVHLFLNGQYRGMYNPTERVNDDFLKAYHGGGDFWDVIGPGNQVLGGDSAAWDVLRVAARRDLTVTANYVDVANRMDLANFVDYLLPHIWSDNDDWPHNNTRAARERVPGARFRFYPWDAEFSFSSHDVSYDTIANTLSTTSPPWGTVDYQQMFNALKRSYEFRLLFADRVHRAFFNDGPLTDARIRALYEPMRARVAPSISGFNNQINTWINNRRRHVTNHFLRAGFLMSSNAPVLNRHGGRVPAGFLLSMTNLAGTIWYTTDGSDPRMPFLSTVASNAVAYTSPLTLSGPMRLRSRSLNGTNWSALVAVEFETSQVGVPMRFTEIMYHPPGGDAYEFLELQNIGGLPADLSGFTLDGAGFRFPTPFPPVPAGARIVLASDSGTNAFRSRYPGVLVAGWFGGSLSNGGERLELIDREGRMVTSVEYGDSVRWPRAADGAGASLENIRPEADPDDPANWQAGPVGGSPGRANAAPAIPRVRISEVQANGTNDWVEFRNAGTNAAVIAGWSFTDDSNPRQYVFPPGTALPPGGFLVVHSAASTNAGIHRAPFRLDRSGEILGLYDAATNRVDLVRYGAVPEGFTLGRPGDGAWTLCEPTPGSPNEPVTDFGAPTNVVLNEFVANPDGGDDWIELHNTGLLPVGVEDWSVTNANGVARIGSPTFIGPGGFAVLVADGDPGADHLDIRLPAAGGVIVVFDRDAAEVSRTSYGPLPNGTVVARIPDAVGEFRVLSFSETPGQSNRVAELGVALGFSRFVARGSGADILELRNASTNPVPLSGVVVVVDPPGLPPFRAPLPVTSVLPPGARLELVCGPTAPGFAPAAGAVRYVTPLPDHGAVLSLLDARGRLLDRVEYGSQIPDRAVVRFPHGWSLASTNATDPRPEVLGSGSGTRINEWMAAAGATNDFVELFNPDPFPVDLARWVLTDDPSVGGATNRPFGPLSFISGGGFTRYRLDGSPADVPAAKLDFRLDALGETLGLFSPAGLRVDSVDYLRQEDDVSEGRYPDGGPQFRRFPGTATPGAPNRVPATDSDADGMDDAWELANGLDPGDPRDATRDADGDGTNNRDEYLAGTDPRSAASVFRAAGRRAAPGTFDLRFGAVAGRTYSVLAAASPAGPWTRVSDVPAGEAREVAVSLDGTAAGARFYRVVTPAMP